MTSDNLPGRLLEHAAIHDELASFYEPPAGHQARWTQDLREAASALAQKNQQIAMLRRIHIVMLRHISWMQDKLDAYSSLEIAAPNGSTTDIPHDPPPQQT